MDTCYKFNDYWPIICKLRSICVLSYALLKFIFGRNQTYSLSGNSERVFLNIRNSIKNPSWLIFMVQDMSLESTLNLACVSNFKSVGLTMCGAWPFQSCFLGLNYSTKFWTFGLIFLRKNLPIIYSNWAKFHFSTNFRQTATWVLEWDDPNNKLIK